MFKLTGGFLVLYAKILWKIMGIQNKVYNSIKDKFEQSRNRISVIKKYVYKSKKKKCQVNKQE